MKKIINWTQQKINNILIILLFAILKNVTLPTHTIKSEFFRANTSFFYFISLQKTTLPKSQGYYTQFSMIHSIPTITLGQPSTSVNYANISILYKQPPYHVSDHTPIHATIEHHEGPYGTGHAFSPTSTRGLTKTNLPEDLYPVTTERIRHLIPDIISSIEAINEGSAEIEIIPNLFHKDDSLQYILVTSKGDCSGIEPATYYMNLFLFSLDGTDLLVVIRVEGVRTTDKLSYEINWDRFRIGLETKFDGPVWKDMNVSVEGPQGEIQDWDTYSKKRADNVKMWLKPEYFSEKFLSVEYKKMRQVKNGSGCFWERVEVGCCFLELWFL